MYLHLVKHGSVRAGELATALSINRTEVYRMLSRLVDGGFIDVTVTRPHTYTANPPDAIFERIVQTHSNQLDRARRLRDEIVPILTAIQNGPTLTGPTLKVIHGRVDICDAIVHLIDTAQTKFVTLNTTRNEGSVAEIYGYYDALVRAAERGTHIDITTTQSQQLIMRREAFRAHKSFEIHIIDVCEPCRFHIRDDKEAILWMSIDNATRLRSEHEVAVRITTPEAINALRYATDATRNKGRDFFEP